MQQRVLLVLIVELVALARWLLVNENEFASSRVLWLFIPLIILFPPTLVHPPALLIAGLVLAILDVERAGGARAVASSSIVAGGLALLVP